MSTMIQFYNVGFTPEKNALVDNFPDYIENVAQKGYITSIQYLKDLDLDMSITYHANQSEFKDFPWNYIKIVQNDFSYYYFITGTNWRTQDTLELVLSMDTLNTFYNHIMNGFVEDRTLVKRQHYDRFYKPQNLVEGEPTLEAMTLYGAVNDTDEGLGGLSKFNFPSDNEVIGDSKKWYLIYSSELKSEDNIKPIDCFVCADQPVTMDGRGTHFTRIKPEDLWQNSADPYLFIAFSEDGATFYLNSVEYTTNANESYLFKKYGSAIQVFKVKNATGTPILMGNFKDVLFTKGLFLRAVNESYGNPSTFEEIDESTGEAIANYKWFNFMKTVDTKFPLMAGVAQLTLGTIKDIDRTQTKLVKIIELPYAPFKDDGLLPEGYIFTIRDNVNLLQLKDLNTTFGQVIGNVANCYNDYYVPELHLRKRSADLGYEPKMLNSQFHTEKFVYDSFSKEIKLENLFNYDAKNNDFAYFNIYFKPSNSINSNMLFDFQLDPNRAEGDYDNIMICRRNNELPLYNSDYLNYLRTGYNFDVKNRDAANAQRWINTATSLTTGTIGAFKGFGSGGIGAVAGAALAGNIVTSLTNTIYAQQQADRDLEQKLAELRTQAGSVQGSDDLDLLNYYNGNKLIRSTYDISPENYNNIRELFRKTGYAVNAYVPVDMNSRRCYNFVQCDPYFKDHGQSDWKEFEDDVIARFNIGVTVYHRFWIGQSPDTNIYDFKQKYENWETWICPRE